MNDSQLALLLRQQNPWWTDAGWARGDPDLRSVAEAPFDYQPLPLAGIRPPGLYFLRGPRRVGKSVELKRGVASLIGMGVAPRAILYCSCDGFRSQDLRRLIAVGHNIARTIPGPKYWLLDEITAVRDGWSPVIKHLRDQAELRDHCVVLTGSSVRELRQATKDLADRRGGVARSDRLLLPMGFRDFCASIGAIGDVAGIDAVAPRDFLGARCRTALEELAYRSPDLAPAWESFLRVGGFPRAVRDFCEHGDVGDGFIEGLRHVIQGDAIRASRLSELEIIAFVARMAEGLGAPVNAARIAADTGMSGSTRVNERIGDLVVTFLAWRCHRLRDDLPNPSAQRKVYLIDPLLARLASHANPRFFEPPAGAVSEQQLGLALSRAVDRDVPGSFIDSSGVMYERTATSAEIDFVGPDLGVPFESKYTDSGWKREARTLRSRYGRGILATRSTYDADGDVWAVPVAAVVWLLGT